MVSLYGRHELTDEREIERFFQMPIEVICWYQLFQRDMNQRGKLPLFASHHGFALSSSSLLASRHIFRFLDGSGGLSQRETCAGCIVSCTTASNCSRNWSRST